MYLEGANGLAAAASPSIVLLCTYTLFAAACTSVLWCVKTVLMNPPEGSAITWGDLSVDKGATPAFGFTNDIFVADISST